MKRLIPALMLLTAFGWTVAGCGDDDDDGGNTGGKGNTAGQPGEPDPVGGETSSSGGAPSVNLGCTPSEATTCQNDTDCPFVLDGTARTTAQTCGKGCLGGEETCARDCILEDLEMTSECASCYADFVNCTIANCVSACLADPDSDGCHTCQEDKGCRPDFNSCSGLPE
jgi:hypothetical protein